MPSGSLGGDVRRIVRPLPVSGVHVGENAQRPRHFFCSRLRLLAGLAVEMAHQAPLIGRAL